jgi:hypothetical protein
MKQVSTEPPATARHKLLRDQKPHIVKSAPKPYLSARTLPGLNDK